MIARLIKSEDDLALLERWGLGYPIIEEILLRHGLYYSNEPSSDIVKSASIQNGLFTEIQGLIDPFPSPLFLR
jgi:hypothetical protein